MQSFMTTDRLRLGYLIKDCTKPWKEPETLVLLHSAMSSSQRFFSWMPALISRYRVVTLDLRGHGTSQLPPPDEPLTVDRLVADVRELLDHIDCKSAHFVGTSAGGYLSQRLAMDYPELVQSIALYGSTPGLKQSQAKDWIPIIKEKGLRTFLADTITDRFPIGDCDPDLVEWFLDQAGGNDPDFIIKFISLMADQEWSDELPKIKCPTLVVIPGLGKIGKTDVYEVMRTSIPDVKMITYDNTPHNIWDFQPDRCTGDLIEFLSGLTNRNDASSKERG